MPLLTALVPIIAETDAVTVDVASLLTTSVSSVQTQLFTALNIIVPAIVSVTAVVIAVKFGIKWMKKITG